MDAIFALAMVRAVTQGNWDFAALSLWEMTPVSANVPVVTPLPVHDILFLSTFIGAGSSANASLQLTPATILLYQGYDQYLSLPYISTPASLLAAGVLWRIQVENDDISISTTANSRDLKLIGSLIAIIQ